ncbi:hypothetical protein D3C72_930530 [compost metagenome]
MLRVVVVGQVRQQEAQRIADAAVAFHHALEDLVRDRQLARVVGRGHPQADDLGAHLVGDVLRCHGVADRLGHLAALAVDGEAVRQQRLVGRLAVQHRRGQQRRVEPAAVLVRAFQVQVGEAAIGFIGGRIVQVVAVRAADHGPVRGAGVEPHVQRVAVLLVLAGLVAQQLGRVQRLPGLDAMLLDAPGHFFQQLRRARVQRSGFLVQEEGHRHAPLALARQGPVRTVGDHGV